MTESDDTKLKKAVGKRLKLFRLFLGISRADLARDTGLSIRALKKFEEGWVKQLASYSKLLEFYTQYGLSSTYLFSGKGALFSNLGPRTPEPMYMLAVFLFPLEVDLERLERWSTLLRNAGFKQQVITQMQVFKNQLQLRFNRQWAAKIKKSPLSSTDDTFI